MSAPTTTEFAAFVGIDWADRKHDVCLLPAGASKPEFSVLPHRPEAIAQWAQELYRRFAGAPQRAPANQERDQDDHRSHRYLEILNADLGHGRLQAEQGNDRSGQQHPANGQRQ